MALPVVAAKAVKVLASFVPPEKLFKTVVLIIMIPITLLAVVVVAPAVALLHIPAASDSQYNTYIQAAKQMNQETELNVKWQEIMAIEAVVLEQRFDKSNASRAYTYKDVFIYEEEVLVEQSCTGDDGESHDCSYYKKVFFQRSLDEAMDFMGLSSRQKEDVRRYMTIDLQASETALPPEEINQAIREAIALVHGVDPDIDESWMELMQVLVMKESSGNPKAYNPQAVWYSLLDGFQHATGLCQVMPPTFKAYKLPGHEDIYNPVDNTIASLRYIKGKYGSVFNIPGLQVGIYRGY
ncbi:transglycosylase SLT domain-containing protein [Neobacillus pocheonensis]|uniref:transglycosylase SLT domain-containing protein n=1 Tax=Neobacillus pocheonensis TaxID=363869 RepID=UPI003D269EDD